MPIPEGDRALIEAWCASAVPAELHDQLLVVAEFRGRSATVIETRPHWRDPQAPWTRSRIAKLTRDSADGTWQLFARDRNDRLLEYTNEFGVGTQLTSALAAIDEDPTGIFWG